MKLEREERDAGALVLRLNDPEKYNALSYELASELTTAVKAAGTDPDCRVIIVTGAGRGFCSGADLGGVDAVWPGTEERSQVGLMYKAQNDLVDMVLAIHECDKPVIAALNGAAVGGGMALALACDLRVAADNARLGARFVRVGLSACDLGTSYLLPRIVGAARAAELMLTGRDCGAEEAERIGLVNKVAPADRLLDAAVDLAALIAANSDYGMTMTKLGMWTNIDAPSLRHAIELENRIQALAVFTGNLSEGAQAFFEKRPAEWKPW